MLFRSLRVEIGTVAAYDDVQIRYKVIIGTKETTTLYNQGIAFGSNTSQIQTDDADTAASDDSTQISVMRPDDAQVFIERFFENILGRSADSAGMAYWMGQMENTTAAYVALGFFNSNEFKDMNLDPHAFVRLLYNTMYGRQADDDGLAYWTNQLNNDVTREAVIFSFLNAAEFSQLSQRYNVKAISDGVEGFVMRFYALVLEIGRAHV